MRELRGWDSVESYSKAGTLCREDRGLAELGAEQKRAESSEAARCHSPLKSPA